MHRGEIIPPIIEGGENVFSIAYVGNRCRQYRKKVLRTELKEVAKELGYSKENISAFENGRNDNCLIMLWYLSRGMTVDQILGGDVIE